MKKVVDGEDGEGGGVQIGIGKMDVMVRRNSTMMVSRGLLNICRQC